VSNIQHHVDLIRIRYLCLRLREYLESAWWSLGESPNDVGGVAAVQQALAQQTFEPMGVSAHIVHGVHAVARQQANRRAGDVHVHVVDIV
jgi:hypothetical protein